MLSLWELIRFMGVLQIKILNLVLFFPNLVFNVDLFKVFIFKEINIKKIILFFV